jgi:hypothetical protein
MDEEGQQQEEYDRCHMCRVSRKVCGQERPSCRQCEDLYLQCIYHSEPVVRQSVHAPNYSKRQAALNVKWRLIKRKGDMRIEGLPVPDEHLMDLIHRAAIDHCESAFTKMHGMPFYHNFESSALMAFAVLVEELLFECTSKSNVEDVKDEDFIQ